MAQRFAIDWPIGTFAANVLGCLFAGVITGVSARGEAISPEMRIALAIGFCGGFTTMSSLIYETAEMFCSGEYFHASLYAAETFLFSLIAFFAGIIAVRFCIRIGGVLWN